MKSRLIAIALVGVSVSGFASSVNASELVYRPTNPTFGGDPLNGNWLLSQATAQTDGGGSPGFTIDFPDFGGVPQDGVTDPDDLPEVPGGAPTGN